MEVLEQRVARRVEVNRVYREALEGVSGITFQTNPNEQFFSNYWLTAIVVDPARTGVTREEIRLACESANIETRPLWKPMHMQPVFASAPFYGDGTSEALFRDGLCLPSGTSLTDEEIAFVAGRIKGICRPGR
jgi:dTDP-4-amino-4,6-dideoxygalactose transaminase